MRKIFAVAAVFISSQLSAQEDSTKTLNTVVVTATKFPQKQNTTGKVITVISKEQIEKSAGRTLSQLLNEQAGITINGALNNLGSVQTVYMRGASSGRTLILIDGIPVNDPGMINNEYDLNLFSLNDVERIEVCKGAQSTLYGSDAVAGVINIITVKQDVQKPVNISSTFSSGSYGTVRGNAQVYGRKDKFTYTGRYARIYSNGFSSAYDSTGHKNYDNDNYDGHVANAQLHYQATPALALKTFALYSRYTAGLDASVFTDDGDYNVHNKSFATGAGFIWKKTRYSINGNYQYNEVGRHYINDSIYKTSTWYENNNYFAKTQFVELYGNVQLTDNFRLLVGGDYRYGSYNQSYYSVSSFGPYASTTPTTSLNQKAAYASLVYSGLNEKLNVEAGGRMNNHSVYGTNNTFTFNPSFSFSQYVRMFGSISTGFKAPSLYQLSLNKKLDPEKSQNYEGGLAFSNQKLSTRAVFFYRKIDNGIDYNYLDFNYFNYIQQNVKGLEWDVNAKLSNALSVNANYAYLEPKETTQNRISNRDTITYSYLLRRPDHTINATLTAQPLSKLSVSVSGKYVSKRFDVGGYQKADVELKGYFLLGAYAEYKHNEHVKFFADAQNITNKKFFDVRGYNSIPFLFHTGLSFNW